MKAGIQSIIQKIHADAEGHVNERYEQIKRDIDEEIRVENEFYLEDYNKRCEILKNHNEHEHSRLLERLSSRMNREILTYQHSLTDEIFDMAVIKLREASEKEFLDMFAAVVGQLKGSFVLSMGELSKNKLDKNMVDKIVCGNEGLFIDLSNETVPNKSGFVLKDDRVEYNCLFEDLIEDKKNELSAAILKEVFKS